MPTRFGGMFRPTSPAEEPVLAPAVEPVAPPIPPGQAALEASFMNDPYWQNWASNMQTNLTTPGNLEALRDQEVARIDAQRAEENRVNALDSRFGTDLSWLDPSFQYQAALLGQSAGSQAFTDPALQQAQYNLLGQNQALANQQLQFQSPAVQQGLANQWAQIQGGQGAPQFMGNAQQQQLMQSLLGVQAPRFSGDADQRQVLNAALGYMNNTGPGSLQFDTSGRQGEQYGNLQGIIAGGGATAIEMADRARARGDSEAWLRGQREADMADYAERGLTGSGMELLSLSSDRQAAAQRNSLADLETAKALEERRLGAINSAAGLATNMRGQTIDEQGLLNNRATAGLGAASSTANSMRDANIREQLGLNQALQSQFTNAANIAGTMRGQDFNERSYLDERMINALGQQTTLANLMRDQQLQEQVAGRSATQNALNAASGIANQVRGAQAQEGQYRASAADDFATRNQSAINNANTSNSQFLQNSYQQMMANRQQWQMNLLNQGINVAGGLMDFDAGENRTGFNQGTNVGTNVSNQFNNAQTGFNSALLNQFNGGQANVLAAQQASNMIYPQIGQWGGDVVGTVAGGLINGASGATGGGGAVVPSAPSTNLTPPTGGSNPYGVGVGGGSNTGTYGTNLGGYSGQLSTSFLPANYDYSRLTGQR